MTVFVTTLFKVTVTNAWFLSTNCAPYLDHEDPQWCYDNFVNYRSLKSADNVREQVWIDT